MMVVGLLALGAIPARAADPENCLSCHQYPGLARIGEDGTSIHLYYVDPAYYNRALGPHAQFACTDCHERSEVEVIPHNPVSPVNCTNVCHVIQPEGLELEFSHGGIHEMLEGSVHTHKVLEECNRQLGQPLRENQAECLFCHDEPRFRRADENWVAHAAPVERCAVCHDKQIPIDTAYMYWHVYARSRPARSPENLARSCAICHSNPRILEAFDLPDTVASYLVSFHGKAMLLGSQETANCLDCHSPEAARVHLMRSHTDEASPTFGANLPDTCRSAACHPTAGPRVSTAAVHLELGTSSGIEFFIGAIFIVLILATFGPSALLQALEMVQIVVNRHDPHQHEREALARQLMSTYSGRQALSRFTPHQRVQHWVLVICFTALVVTGFPIKFAEREWARWLVNLLGGLTIVRHVHHYAGAVLIAGFFYHMTYVAVCAWRQKRRTKQSWFRIILGLPMMTNPREIRQLFHQLGFLLFIKRTRPAGDRFTLKEKFEYFGVFWGTVLLGITGVLMWANAWTSAHFTGRVLTVALVVHGFEAFLALLHVGIIHLIGVIFSPVVFPLSPAMFNGDTPPAEMAENHGGMLERASRGGASLEGGSAI
jgi:cytochrome b subunit of formate dehydrogenase